MAVEQIDRRQVYRPTRSLVIGGNVLDTYKGEPKPRAGGNGVNVTGALERLGHRVTLITPAPAPEIIAAVTGRGADVIALRPDEGDGTPKETVYMGDEKISEIRPERDYKINFEDPQIPDYDVLVLSSVDSLSWPEIYEQGSIHARENDKFLAILPGSTQIKDATNEKFSEALHRADLICLNRKELISLLEIRREDLRDKITTETSLLDLVRLAAEEFGPDKYISVTDKAESVLYTKDDQVLRLQRFGEESSTSIGAGDAYAATLIYSLAKGDAPEDAITNAGINAFMTTQETDAHSGHQTQEDLAKLREASPDYRPVKIYPEPDQ